MIMNDSIAVCRWIQCEHVHLHGEGIMTGYPPRKYYLICTVADGDALEFLCILVHCDDKAQIDHSFLVKNDY